MLKIFTHMSVALFQDLCADNVILTCMLQDAVVVDSFELISDQVCNTFVLLLTYFISVKVVVSIKLLVTLNGIGTETHSPKLTQFFLKPNSAQVDKYPIIC